MSSPHAAKRAALLLPPLPPALLPPLLLLLLVAALQATLLAVMALPALEGDRARKLKLLPPSVPQPLLLPPPPYDADGDGVE